jgi:hypothetical protein
MSEKAGHPKKYGVGSNPLIKQFLSIDRFQNKVVVK